MDGIHIMDIIITIIIITTTTTMVITILEDLEITIRRERTLRIDQVAPSIQITENTAEKILTSQE